MKNFNKIITSFVGLSFVLSIALASPVLASANIGAGLGLGVNANVNLEEKGKIGVNGEVRTDLKANVKDSKDESDKDKKENKENKEDRELPRGIENRLDDGKDVPPGFWFRFFNFFGINRSHEIKDEAKLKIEHLDVSVGTTSASVAWDTNVKASGEVRYGTTKALSATSSVVTGGSLTLNHEFHLSGLATSTTYYYKVISKDADNNVRESAVLHFKTNGPDDLAPKIAFVGVLDVQADSAQIVWITNEKASGKIWLSTSSPVVTSGAALDSSSALSFFHEFNLNGLQSGTKYFYTVSSTDVAGNVRISADNSFTTAD